MGINRRNFLKGVGLGSLTNLVSSSEGEQPIDENDEKKRTIGKFQHDLALHSLSIAEDYLNDLINRKCTGPHNTYASNIGSATMFIHQGVWSELPKYKTVREKYIPLLKEARDSIDINDSAEIKKHNPKSIKNNADYQTYAMHIKACVSFRMKNLERYCKGLNADVENCVKKVKKEGKYEFID